MAPYQSRHAAPRRRRRRLNKKKVAVMALCTLLLAAGIGWGAAALVRRRGRTDAFDRAAEKLLGERTAAQGMEGAQVLLSPAGLSLRRRGAEIGPRPLSLILETEDLLLLFGEETVTVLQKKDLCRGTLPALREVLGAQIPYETVLRDD